MYLVREVFVAKPGSVNILARIIKEILATSKGYDVKVVFDFESGSKKIIIEHKIKNMIEFVKEMHENKEGPSPELTDKIRDFSNLYECGKKEIYKIIG